MPESNHTFYIKLSKEGVSLNPVLLLPLVQTNLPHASIRFRPGTELFWLVAIRTYDKERKKLSIDVLEYEPEDITSFFTQNPKAPVVYLEFTKIIWSNLHPHLSSYKKADFNHLIETESKKESSPVIVQRTSDWQFSQNNRIVQNAFHVPFNKAKFVTGGVLVTHRFDGHDVELLIGNDFILKEFELLKDYFAKALDKKQFSVNATIEIQDGQIKNAVATSPDISRIDETLLTSVRYLEARTIRHIAPPDINKELFSADEMYGREQQDENAKTGMELLEILIGDEQIRNRKQIQYLAGKLHTPHHKILFTAQPQFGFLFLVPGETLKHFIWELLDSHATYLWSYDPQTTSDNLALRKLEYAIGTIRKHGRQAYRFEMIDDMGISDLHFHVINHEKVSSSVIDSFPIWRARLHERLV